MYITAIIVAGGSGKRMQSEVPKQFIELNGLPILMRTINVFYRFDKKIDIIVVLPKSLVEYWKQLCDEHHFNVLHRIAIGGEKRFHSVKKGLELVKNEGLVAIHDGVRPLVSHDTLVRCIGTAGEKGNAIPVIPIVESVRIIQQDKNRPFNRNLLSLVQTPQVFKTELIKKAYEQPYMLEFTDDAGVLEKLGYEINLVEGNKENIKITTRSDLFAAEGLADKFDLWW